MIFCSISRWFEGRRHARIAGLFALPEGALVLDASCGDGDLVALLQARRPDLKLSGVDLREEEIAKARERVPRATFAMAPAEKLPYADGIFDAVLSCMSLHHYERANEVMREIGRVLTPAGRLYVVDFFPLGRMVQFFYNATGCPEPYHFERYLRPTELAVIAREAGLTLLSTRKTRRSFLSVVRMLVLARTAPSAVVSSRE